MWTVCGRRWSRSCRAPCGRSESPSTNSSSTSSSLGRSTRWLRNRPGFQRAQRPAARGKSSKTASAVGLSWRRCPVIIRRTSGVYSTHSPVSSSSVSCGVGTFYSGEQDQCVQCPPGTYQDTVGQLSCEPCPSTEGQGIAGAKNVSQCGGNSFTFPPTALKPLLC